MDTSCGDASKKKRKLSAANGEGDDRVYNSVSDYYGKQLASSKDLKTNACTAGGKPHDMVLDALKKVPQPVKDKFYGCGSPLPLGIDGLSVLDLGSGSGQDCYLVSALVGEKGSVLGIDMTDEQLATARTHVDEFTKTMGYAQPNMKFVKGYIEFLDKANVESESMDLVISNCVVNLSPNKERVISEVYRVLKPGGEFYFSDVYCDRRIPDELRKNEVLFGECLSGALYVEDFRRICQKVGFLDPRVISKGDITVNDKESQELLGNCRFYSITYRLFKLPETMETLCEDYGQVATYKGGIPGNTHNYTLDDHHIFYKNKPELVCGNTASMLEDTWLSKYFTISGDRSTHFGLFDCSGGSVPPPAPGAAPAPLSGGGCC